MNPTPFAKHTFYNYNNVKYYNNLSQMENFSLGDSVTFITHPYFDTSTDVIISGEPQHTPPIMIIIEVKALEEKDSQDRQVSQSSIRFKCLWFSIKSNTFISKWFSGIQLKLIEKSIKDANLRQPDDLIGSQVTLKCQKLEMGKTKKTLHIQIGKSDNTEKSNISSLLSFVGPVMQIIETSKNKEFNINSPNKTFEYLAKCKWYNSLAEKFTETLLPLVALQPLLFISKENIEELKIIIKEKKVLWNKKQIFQPKSISYRSGMYYVSCYNFLTNQLEESLLNDLTIEKLDSSSTFFVKHAPNFKIEKDDNGNHWNLRKDVEDLITSSKGNYIRIIYRDANGNQTIRTISDASIIPINEPNINNPSGTESTDYVFCSCCLRDEKRHFRLDRIEKAWQLLF